MATVVKFSTLPKDETKAFHDLLLACRSGDVVTVQASISSGQVNINSVDRYDASPLILASLCGHFDVVRLLLESGATCERDTYQGERAIYNALNDKIRKLLLSYNYSTATDAAQDYVAHLTSLLPRKDNLEVVHPDAKLKIPLTLKSRNEASSIFDVHSWILISRCSFFKNARTRTNDSETLALPIKVSTRAAEVLLRFIYLAEIDTFPDEIISDVEDISEALDLPELWELAVASLNTKERREKRKAILETAQNDLRIFWKETLLPASIKCPSYEIRSVLKDVQHTWAAFSPDVILRADEEDEDGDITTYLYPVHKVMLRSEFFVTMFASGFREGQSASDGLQIVPLDCLPVTLELVLEWTYSDLVEPPLELSLDLLYTADMLFIDKLKVKASSVLSTAGNIDDLMEGKQTGFTIFDVVRAGWATRVHRLDEFGAKYIAERLDMFLDGPARPEFEELIKESAFRIKDRQETDTIDLVDDIRYYLNELHRMRSDDVGAKWLVGSEDVDAKDKATIENGNVDKLQEKPEDPLEKDEKKVKDVPNGIEEDTGLQTSSKVYDDFMDRIDDLLAHLNLDA